MISTDDIDGSNSLGINKTNIIKDISLSKFQECIKTSNTLNCKYETTFL